MIDFSLLIDFISDRDSSANQTLMNQLFGPSGALSSQSEPPLGTGSSSESRLNGQRISLRRTSSDPPNRPRDTSQFILLLFSYHLPSIENAHLIILVCVRSIAIVSFVHFTTSSNVFQLIGVCYVIVYASSLSLSTCHYS